MVRVSGLFCSGCSDCWLCERAQMWHLSRIDLYGQDHADVIHLDLRYFSLSLYLFHFIYITLSRPCSDCFHPPIPPSLHPSTWRRSYGSFLFMVQTCSLFPVFQNRSLMRPIFWITIFCIKHTIFCTICLIYYLIVKFGLFAWCNVHHIFILSS